MEKPFFKPAGDLAVIVEWKLPVTPELNSFITGLKFRLELGEIPGITDVVPAYSTLMVYYDPAVIGYSMLVEEISRLIPEEQNHGRKIHRNKTVIIPVFYGGEYGPDLEHIAAAKNLSGEDVVKIHCGAVYYVYMIGFLPGYPYLGFVDQRIAVGRRSEPRQVVPAGSVGIAGRQTGIYSLNSPGGWQIIGRTPVKLFKAESNEFLLMVGDKVIFRPVGDKVRFSDIDPECWGDLYGNSEGD